MDVPLRSSYIIAEDHTIASPLVDFFSLKRDDALEKFRAYSNESILLVVSRGESYSAAALVGLLLGRYGYDEGTRLFHIGRCLPAPGTVDQAGGRVVLVNRVVEHAARRSYLPDILLRHELPEASIETIPPQADTSSSLGDSDESSDSKGGGMAPRLIDRELAGAVAAALTFLAPHQVYALSAVVHTPLAGEVANTSELISAAMPKIGRLITESSALLGRARPTLGAEAEALLDEVAASMRLTVSQTAQLGRLAAEATARGGNVPAILSGWDREAPIRSKQERSKRFDELRDRFADR